MRPWTNKSLCLGILGLFLVVLGKLLCFIGPTVFHHILQNGLALSPNSRSFEVWKNTSSLPPMFLKIYLFNWTNPEELSIRGKKPRFDQVGPYCFREVRQKDNITFNKNKTVSYLQRRLWYFDKEHSNGSLRDIITHLDIVATSAAHKIRYWDHEWQASLSLLLRTRTIYISKTVDELLFTGYSDTLLTMGKMVASDDVPAFDRFGWFYMRNNTDIDGHLNMETGEDDINKLGILRKWNYKDTTNFHRSPCNLIEGSAGEFWPPDRTKDEITLFSLDICRPLIYEYEATVSHLGIEGYRYAIDKKTLGNATRRRYPHEQAKFITPTTTTEDFFASDHSAEIMRFTTTENIFGNDDSSKNTDEYPNDDPDVINTGHCYCNGECVPSGLLNITACRYGAPVFVSLPHFYKTDPNVLDQVEGLNPNENHSFSIILEPTTGIPLKVSANLQVNILLHSSEVVSLFYDVPKIYMPMLWFSLEVEVTEEMVSNLNMLLALPNMMLCTGISIAIVGLCLIGVVAFLYLKKKRHIPATDTTEEKVEKPVDDPSEKKSEMVYMDKISGNEDPNVRTDRRLYVKLY